MFSVLPVTYCKAIPLPPEGKEDKVDNYLILK